jgi:hypothetical protein
MLAAMASPPPPLLIGAPGPGQPHPARPGLIHTTVHSNRVHLTGQAITVLDGTLHHTAG